MLRLAFKFVAAAAFTGVLMAQQPSTPPDTIAPAHAPNAAHNTADRANAAQAQPAVASNPAKSAIKTTAYKGKRAKKAAQQQPEPAPAPPAPPPTPEQMPALPPQVTYNGGLLSITAQNSTMGDILSAVRRALGTTIEGGSGAGERLIVRLGPGEPNDVLRQLLAGSRFDYVILGSMQRPGAIDRIVLTPRQTGPGAAGAPGTAVAQQQQPNVPVGRSAAPQPQADADEGPDSDVDEGELAPEREPEQPQAEDEQQQQQQQPAQAEQPNPGQLGTTGQPQPGQPQPGMQPGMQPNPPQNAPATDANGNPQNPNQQQTGPKSPEQLLRELQQMQKQQQQNQQDQQNQEPQ